VEKQWEVLLPASSFASSTNKFENPNSKLWLLAIIKQLDADLGNSASGKLNEEPFTQRNGE